MNPTVLSSEGPRLGGEPMKASQCGAPVRRPESGARQTGALVPAWALCDKLLPLTKPQFPLLQSEEDDGSCLVSGGCENSDIN